jgi:predicted PurR-regulated permease PerM
VLPIVLAILLKLLLQPGVRRLERVRIPRAIAAYLLTVTIMNAAVGVGTRLATWATGLGNPALWGVMAFLLNYIPVIEPIISLVLLLLAGLLTIEPLWSALLPGAGFFAIHAIEGQFVTPIHTEPRGRHRFPRFLVLDVGSARCHSRGSRPRHRQNHLRQHSSLGCHWAPHEV